MLRASYLSIKIDSDKPIPSQTNKNLQVCIAVFNVITNWTDLGNKIREILEVL
jgi:hypothetical protein